MRLGRLIGLLAVLAGILAAVAATLRAKSTIAVPQDLRYIEAFRSGDLVKVQDAVRHGATVRGQVRGITPLALAASGYHPEPEIRWLLNQGADVNGRDEDGRTALMWAAGDAGAASVVKVLLDHGANAALVDRAGKSALIYAADQGDLPVIHLLLQHGAQPLRKDRNGWSAVKHALVHGHYAVAKKLKGWLRSR